MSTTRPVLTVKSSAGLEEIIKPGRELVLWRRHVPLCLTRWLERLPPNQLPDGRLLALRTDLRGALNSLLKARTPRHAMRDLLLEDLVHLAGLYAALTKDEVVDLRLETLTDDGCPAFHRDNVAVRLLTTYRGPGTEWIDPSSEAGAEACVQRFPSHAVGVFRGQKSTPGGGLLHRSPPLAGTGAVRLLFCVNQRSKASPALWMDEADHARRKGSVPPR